MELTFAYDDLEIIHTADFAEGDVVYSEPGQSEGNLLQEDGGRLLTEEGGALRVGGTEVRRPVKGFFSRVKEVPRDLGDRGEPHVYSEVLVEEQTFRSHENLCVGGILQVTNFGRMLPGASDAATFVISRKEENNGSYIYNLQRAA